MTRPFDWDFDDPNLGTGYCPTGWTIGAGLVLGIAALTVLAAIVMLAVNSAAVTGL